MATLAAAVENRSTLCPRDGGVASDERPHQISDTVGIALFTKDFLEQSFSTTLWDSSQSGVQGLVCILWSVALFHLHNQERFQGLAGVLPSAFLDSHPPRVARVLTACMHVAATAQCFHRQSRTVSSRI